MGSLAKLAPARTAPRPVLHANSSGRASWRGHEVGPRELFTLRTPPALGPPPTRHR